MSDPTHYSARSRAFLVLAVVCVFCSAALLFMVQPMLAKWLLPTLGGTPATWSTCLATFQLLLLAGYCYVHWATSQLASRALARAQLTFVPTACFAVWQADWSTPELQSTHPVLGIFALLIVRIGLPYTMLATSLPLLSHWVAPWGRRAIAVVNVASNAGALAGLLLYPFVIEPAWDVQRQLSLWSGGLLAFGGLMLATCTLSLSAPTPALPREESSLPPASQLIGWALYSLVPSALLLAATNHITTDIAATPLFWVVPLALYLLSYVMAFGIWSNAWRTPTLLLWGAATAALGINGFTQGAASFTQQIGATLLSLFAACLLCHGELALTRPATGLSRYYLVIASGGAAGGTLVGWVAPFTLSDHYELEFASLAIPVVLVVASRNVTVAWTRRQRSLLALAAGLCLPLLFGSLWVRTDRETHGGHIVERRRSLLGTQRVVDTEQQRFLVHGRIQHGMQLRDPAQHARPTMYFGAGTAVERVLTASHPERSRHIGVVGMGVGTLAAYGRLGDRMRFYEIDANVEDLAKQHFTFLADSKASIEIIIGDGRLSLQQEPPQHFDVLVLDAFSSDAVPVHLLTREAFEIYRSQLAADGVLLVNVSNRHLAVDRVVQASAQAIGWNCVLSETPSNAATHVSHVMWAVIGPNPGTLDAITTQLPTVTPTTSPVLWTDARASVLSILR